MAQDIFRMGTGLEIGTDKAGVTISGKAYNIHRQQVVVVQPADASQIGHPVGQVLRSEVTGSGGFDGGNLNVNGSFTPVLCSYTPSTQQLLADALVLSIRDSGAWASTKFGTRAALSIGLLFQVFDSGAQLLSTLFNLKDNQDIAALADSVAFPWPDLMVARLNLAALGVSPLMPASSTLRVTVRDDLTTIEEVRVSIRGRLI